MSQFRKIGKFNYPLIDWGLNSIAPQRIDEDDERGVVEQLIERWLGTWRTFTRHYLWRRGERRPNGWTLVVTVLWVYQVYLFWNGYESFTLYLRLLKPAQRRHRDELESQLKLRVWTGTDWKTLAPTIKAVLVAALPPILEQRAQARNAGSNEAEVATTATLWQGTWTLKEKD